MERIIITIDGASSTGKSSLAKAIAKHYGFTHIDSGAMYRALTFYAQDKKLLVKLSWMKSDLWKFQTK
jgi:cytidylate kinase